MQKKKSWNNINIVKYTTLFPDWLESCHFNKKKMQVYQIVQWNKNAIAT